MTKIKLLLEKKAYIVAKDNIGRTPLHHAALRGDPTTYQLLLDRKAIDL